ncbi:uncharacterized protein [Spinacia oleracea]|uniref:Uncharacterized protein isoform X2 n=1 Tax=Spinacia oleracea TaxID=3562 RepID=A0A9R0JD80_SPIOL|nr:uncharacterized protein LOC110804120 isoform X2 [Spinacia oleracea]
MATSTLSISPSSLHFLSHHLNSFTSSPPPPSPALTLSPPRRFSKLSVSSPDVCHSPHQPLIIDQSALVVEEAVSEEALWAAACLRIRTFNEFKEDTFRVEDHKRYLTEREFEALKERVAGKRKGFRTVSCINASLPLSHLSALSGDLCISCKGIGADFLRAYLSNVCVAKELHRNGLGYALVSKSKCVAEKWGITDLYVHAAVDNESAKKLYMKSGFTYESDEPAWQARFANRPKRIILWFGLPNPYNL